MNGWELFLGIAIGNMLGTWVASRDARVLKMQFDEATAIIESYQRLGEKQLELLTTQNEQICQAREN